MKKLIIISLLTFFPIILNAEQNENFIEIEENVEYKKDAEQVCEYFDLENYFYSDWVYSLEKPDSYSYREIEQIEKEIQLDRNYHNILKIINFANYTTKIKIYEIEIYDKDNNYIEFELGHYGNIDGDLNKINDKKLDTYVEAYSYGTLDIIYKNTQNINDLTIKVIYEKNDQYNGLNFYTKLHDELQTNSFARYETINTLDCNENLCETTQKVKENELSNSLIKFNTFMYKYRDKYFKCYTPKKIELNKTTPEKENQLIIKNDPITIKEPKEIIYKEPIIENIGNESEIDLKENDTDLKESESIKNNEKVAMISKEKPEEKTNTFAIVIMMILIPLILLAVLYTKKVIKSRTK